MATTATVHPLYSAQYLSSLANPRSLSQPYSPFKVSLCPAVEDRRTPLSPSSNESNDMVLDSSAPLKDRPFHSEVELENAQPQTSLLEKPIHQPTGWPASPRAVKSSVFSGISDLLVDAVLLLISLLFLVFGLVVRYHDQAPIAVHPGLTKVLLECAKYGPTVFPILFASALGRATHAILVWRLERGERIGTLDILAGSTSLTDTISSQLQLRVVTALGLMLLATWSLSPVGGQASLRLLSIGPKMNNATHDFTYPVYDQFFADSYFANAGTGMDEGFVGKHVARAAIVSSGTTRNMTADLWGNVKAPYIEPYEGNEPYKNGETPDTDGWFFTNETRNTYSSLIGVPLSGVVENQNTTFLLNLETRYLYNSCERIPGQNPATGNTSAISWDVASNPYPLPQYRNTTSKNGQPAIFSLIRAFGAYVCYVTTTYVELGVSCNPASTEKAASSLSSSCVAYKMRRSKLEHPSSANTAIEDKLGSMEGWQLMTELATTFEGRADQTLSSPTAFDGYLVNLGDPVSFPWFPWKAEEDPIPHVLVAERLGQLMNTWWNALASPSDISSGLSVSPIGKTIVNTTGTASTRFDVIQSHNGWVAVLCVTSAILVMASLVRPVVRYCLTSGPDVLLNFSSLATRNNEYIALPPSGTFMESSDRAKLLKNLKVRFGDVRADSEVGQLVIGGVETLAREPIGRVRKQRVYM